MDNNRELMSLVDEWEPKLLNLSEDFITFREDRREDEGQGETIIDE